MERPAGTTVSGEQGALFVTTQLFDRIVASDRALLAIDTPRGEELLSQFRQFALRSGSTIYAWSEADGIASLRESGVSVPGSTRLPDALRWIHGSVHFGVYLFPALDSVLRFSPARAQALALLRQIARVRKGGPARKVVLIDRHPGFGDGIDELMDRIVDTPADPRRLKLRDGRWVRG